MLPSFPRRRESSEPKSGLHDEFYNRGAQVSFLTAFPESLDSRLRGNDIYAKGRSARRAFPRLRFGLVRVTPKACNHCAQIGPDVKKKRGCRP